MNLLLIALFKMKRERDTLMMAGSIFQFICLMAWPFNLLTNFGPLIKFFFCLIGLRGFCLEVSQLNCLSGLAVWCMELSREYVPYVCFGWKYILLTFPLGLSVCTCVLVGSILLTFPLGLNNIKCWMISFFFLKYALGFLCFD